MNGEHPLIEPSRREFERNRDADPVGAVPINFKGRTDGLDGFDFTLAFPYILAARLPCTLIVRAFEEHCIAFEGTDFDYPEQGVNATFRAGKGSKLTDHMRRLIEWVAKSPNGALLAYAPAVQPVYLRIAAAAIQDPERFAQVENDLRDVLDQQAPRYWPTTCMPCMDEAVKALSREQSRNVIEQLWDKTLRRARLAIRQ